MRYAVWNNKGGVGKTFLSFVLGTEIANERKIPVVLVDMCPQANLSEIVLGGNGIGSERLDSLIKKRQTIGGISIPESIRLTQKLERSWTICWMPER